MKALTAVALPLCISMVLAGCGGSSSGTASPTANIALSANQFDIGSDIALTLSGAASQAKNGAIASYVWSVASAPQFSHAQVERASAAEAYFSPDVPGSYSLCLTVTDEKKSSAPDCETLTVTNSVPLALVGGDAIVLVGQQYQLDASRSLPPTNGTELLLGYQWEIESAPEGSAAILDDPNLSAPRFTADLEGEYVLSLRVSYEDELSEKAMLNIVVNSTNALPIANAGGNITTWVLGEKLTLDGTGSYDPDGDALQYRWGFGYSPLLFAGALPDGSKVVLENLDTATPSFVPDMIGTYRVWLQVYDGTSTSYSSIEIKVDTLPQGHVNTKPVAFISAPWGKTFEAELGSKVSFTATYSYDKETVPYALHNIGKRWKLLRHPEGFDVATHVKTQEFGTEAAPSFSITFDKAGEYDVQLEVFDGELWSDPYVQTFTALTGANRPPTANPAITGVGAVSVGHLVTLDGEGSTDPDGNRLGYAWKLLQKPSGSNAVLSSTTSAFPTFTADVAGPYFVELTVTDSHNFSSDPKRLQVFAKARNNAPVARPSLRYKAYDATQPLLIYPTAPVDLNTWQNGQEPYHNSVHFVADASDPDGDSLSYLWSLLEPTENHKFAWATNSAGNMESIMSGTCTNGYNVSAQGPYTTPAELYNAVIALRDWTCSDLNLAPVAAGNYRVQLLVSDGIDTAGPYEFTIPVVERSHYPSLLLERTTAANTDVQGEIKERSDYAKQQLFPYVHEQQGSFPVFDSYFEPSQHYVSSRYRLTAFDQDYTIVDLKAVVQGISAEMGYAISIEGLTEGQVITKGHSVEFTLLLDMPEEIKRYQSDDIFAPPPNLGSGLNVSFAIKERAGWTFSYTPYIYPSR